MTIEKLDKAVKTEEEIERYKTLLEIINAGSIRLTVGNFDRSMICFPKGEFKEKLTSLFQSELDHLQKEFDAL